MPSRVMRVSIAFLLIVVATACSKSNPVQPSGSTTSVAADLTASVAAPRPISPANGITIRNVDQPVTLVVQNAIVTKSGGTTYTFEVATDSAFATKVQIKDGVSESGGGQTSVKLETLAANKDHYWHVRATAGGTTGVFGAVFKFTIGPAITIGAPTPIGPLTGGAPTNARPTFSVTNAAKSGFSGTLLYRFDVTDNAAFTSVIFTNTVPETPGQTSWTPAVDLPLNKTLYWRATAIAIDQTGTFSGPASAVQSFIASTPSSPFWSGVQPPGSTGHAVLGDNWQTQTVVSFTGVTFTSPTLEEQQVFDLLDRGFDPQGAIDWMHSNGYPTSAAYFADVNVIGFQFGYMALIRGRWDLVIRVGA